MCIKKLKREILLYPNEEMKEGDVWVSVSLITIKNLYGQMMKAGYGYPFMVIINEKRPMSYFFLEIIEKLIKSEEVVVFKGYFNDKVESMLKLKEEKEKLKKEEKSKSKKEEQNK